MDKKEEELVQIALLYYEEGYTQTEIAKKYNISRPTVAARLQEAKDKGIVKISIQHGKTNLVKLENSISQKYNLKTVLIAPTSPQSKENTKSHVGRLCASFVSKRLNEINSIGIGWGTTIHEFVKAVEYQQSKNLSIVSLIGGIGNSDIEYHSNHLAFSLAEKLGCSINYFYAPAIAETIEMKNSFLESKIVRDTLDLGKNVDLAILGVGNPIESSTYSQLGYINANESEEIINKGAVGDISANFYNIYGDNVETSFSSRMIGLSMDDIANLKELLIIASGIEKAVSIKALLEKGYVDHLIIDDQIASLLL